MAVLGHAYIEIHAITRGFRDEIERALNDLDPLMRRLGERGGRSLGDSLGRGLKRSGLSNLEQESMAAKDALNQLIRTGYKVGPAIAGIASAISDVVFGLGSMISAIGAAGPAVSALGGSLAALLQGGITAKLALGGIGKAVGAINKSQGGGGANNNKAIEDARRRLAMVYQRTADQMAAANDKVRQAQIALNAAYKKGVESLQQLGFDAEDAALSQQKAAIELERARETLMRSQDLPVNDRGRREAELAFKEAELNYRKTTDQVNDLREQQAYAAATGVEGTQEVLDAKQNLYQAEQQRAKQERDSAQDIAEAQRAVAEALNKSSGAASAINQAMKDLSPEARKFAKYIAGLKPVMLDLKAAAGRQLFGPLQSAIQNLVDKLVPVLIPMFESTGKVLGEIAVAVSDVFTSTKNLQIFKKIFGGANLTVLRNFGNAFANILDVALKVLEAASPLTIRFSKWVETLTAGWKASMNAEGAVGKLTDKFNHAGDIAGMLGGVLKKTWDAFKVFFGAGTEAGIGLFQSFGDAMDKFKQFGEESKKNAGLQNKFGQIAKNVKAIGTNLGMVAKIFFDLSGSEGVQVFAEGIRPAIKIIGEIGKTLAGKGIAKAMSGLVVSVAKLIQKFTESGGVENFFNTLKMAVDILNKIFSNKLVMQVFTFMAALHGVTLAFGTIFKASSFMGKALFGKLLTTRAGLMKVKDAAGMAATQMGAFRDGLKYAQAGTSNYAPVATRMGGVIRGLATRDMALARGSMQGLSTAFMAGTGPVLLVIAAIAAAVAIFALAYQNSEKLRKAVEVFVKVIKDSFQKAWEDVQKALGDAGIKVESLQEVFGKIGDFLAVTLMPIITTVFSGLVRYIGGVIAGLIRIVKGLWNYIEGIIEVFKGVWALVTGDFEGFKTHMGKAFGKFVDGISSIIMGLASPFVAVWNGIADGWNRTIGGMTFDIPDWVPIVGGKKWTMFQLPKIGDEGKPKIPKNVNIKRYSQLADGGIVRATPGGIHAVIGEAGRNERVEPLDPDGLSKRDKAMIDYLTSMRGGGGAAPVFNVYPSQGMDERTLAHLVSRRVGWELKRGV